MLKNIKYTEVSEQNRQNSPTHILPIIRHPAMDAWTTGIVSESSPSKTLQEKGIKLRQR